MKIQMRWAIALIACACMSCLNQAQAQKQRNYRNTSNAAEMASASLASYNSFNNSYGCDLGEGCCDSGNCGSCNTCCNSCYGGGGMMGRPGQFFIGADYLHVRSTFSESTAFVTAEGGTGTPLLPPVVYTFNEIDYDYEPSYRVYGGYRLCECGCELRFGFTNLSSSGAADTGPVPVATNGRSTQFLYPAELVATNVGDRLVVDSNVNANIYDLGIAKTIPLGSPPCGGCCDPCCNSCCGWCPAWDIKWSAGIRFADVDWDRTATRQSVTSQLNGDYRSTTMDFQGGGARVGLEGTRYIGKQQRFAIFAKSDLSILLGDVNIVHVNDTPQTTGIDITTRFNSTQLIPVLDIEAGATVFLTDCLTVSGGYLFSAWHDLGMRDTFDVLEGRGPTFDDANILGFDGFFVRTELSF